MAGTETALVGIVAGLTGAFLLVIRDGAIKAPTFEGNELHLNELKSVLIGTVVGGFIGYYPQIVGVDGRVQVAAVAFGIGLGAIHVKDILGVKLRNSKG